MFNDCDIGISLSATNYSLVDLEMMASVCAALPPQARLILLGDKDQLASVEAGAVLGDICHGARIQKSSVPASTATTCRLLPSSTSRCRS